MAAKGRDLPKALLSAQELLGDSEPAELLAILDREELALKTLKNHFLEELERVQLEETLLRTQIDKLQNPGKAQPQLGTRFGAPQRFTAGGAASSASSASGSSSSAAAAHKPSAAPAAAPAKAAAPAVAPAPVEDADAALKELLAAELGLPLDGDGAADEVMEIEPNSSNSNSGAGS